jgi:hypothetical protein
MKYFFVEPEVAGGFGPNIDLDTSVHPPIIHRLNYEFDGWLGDVLLESFPVWIVTLPARDAIKALGCTGVRFDEVEVTTSGLFEDIYPDRQLPEFAWMRVEGKAGEDDFGVLSTLILVVSERALKTLQDLGLNYAEIAEFQ